MQHVPLHNIPRKHKQPNPPPPPVPYTLPFLAGFGSPGRNCPSKPNRCTTGGLNPRLDYHLLDTCAGSHEPVQQHARPTSPDHFKIARNIAFGISEETLSKQECMPLAPICWLDRQQSECVRVTVVDVHRVAQCRSMAAAPGRSHARSRWRRWPVMRARAAHQHTRSLPVPPQQSRKWANPMLPTHPTYPLC